MSVTYYAVTNDPNELMHFGIKGMRWGIRRTDAQLGHPRHSGSRSRRPRSAAYKNAESKLHKMMKSGIKKAEANWRAYNSPKAKEERFMKKAMEQARTGTLKYGKLTDAQVRKVTDRLALERNARMLGSTENPKYSKRLKTAIGEGIIRGIGGGTGAYIEERMRGRGRTTADIKRDKRMDKYEAKEATRRNKSKRAIAEEYYRTAAEEGDMPRYKSAKRRAQYLADVKKRNKADDYAASIRKTYDEQEARVRASNDARRIDDIQRGINAHREERRLQPSKVTWEDPVTKAQFTGTRWQHLNAMNTVHEKANDYHRYMSSMENVRKVDSARQARLESTHQNAVANTSRKRKKRKGRN